MLDDQLTDKNSSLVLIRGKNFATEEVENPITENEEILSIGFQELNTLHPSSIVIFKKHQTSIAENFQSVHCRAYFVGLVT